MDSCMVDATGLDVRRGSSVEIFGDHASIHALAEATGTIAYELLCRIPQRVRRRHLRT
jgi:alanine racemase